MEVASADLRLGFRERKRENGSTIGKRVSPSPSSATLRNTPVREVTPIRLSVAERAQIAGAAARRKLTVSGFIRQAALQASAIVEGKASVRRPEEPRQASAYDERGLVIVDPEPAGHWVDGELVSR